MILIATRSETIGDAARAAYRAAFIRQRGPGAVLGSLRRGLAELRVPFALNRWAKTEQAEAVGVLSGLGALEAGIRWRSKTDNVRLLAGPNLVVLPSEAPGAFLRPELDAVLVPSQWVREQYECDMPELTGRVVVWPAGVNPHFWKPSPSGDLSLRSQRALFFIKEIPGQANASRGLLSASMAAAERAGFEVGVVRYGTYSRRSYLEELQKSDVMVAFSASESQGIALAEAWAVDVPTLVWNRGIATIGGAERRTSSAPYLCDATGLLFESPSELECLLGRMRGEVVSNFSPREWVIREMSDVVCARRYCEIAGIARLDAPEI